MRHLAFDGIVRDVTRRLLSPLHVLAALALTAGMINISRQDEWGVTKATFFRQAKHLLTEKPHFLLLYATIGAVGWEAMSVAAKYVSKPSSKLNEAIGLKGLTMARRFV